MPPNWLSATRWPPSRRALPAMPRDSHPALTVRGLLSAPPLPAAYGCLIGIAGAIPIRHPHGRHEARHDQADPAGAHGADGAEWLSVVQAGRAAGRRERWASALKRHGPLKPPGLQPRRPGPPSTEPASTGPAGAARL